MQRHLHFEVNGQRLLGALHLPEAVGEGLPGLVLLHGWAGYRIGAHQMFVKLAREAESRGFACLRFDFRGRGDSEGDMSEASLSTMIRDACEAARVLLCEAGVKDVALVGDCSGSEVAIGAGPLIPGCRALVLWSAPIVAGSRARTDRAKRTHIVLQYLAKLLRPQTWSKLIAGRLQPAMIRKALVGGGKGAGEEGSESDKDIDWLGRFSSFRGAVHFIYGDSDPTTAAAVEHYRALTHSVGRPWRCHLVQGANHAFYSLAWEREVIERTLGWLSGTTEARDGD